MILISPNHVVYRKTPESNSDFLETTVMLPGEVVSSIQKIVTRDEFLYTNYRVIYRSMDRSKIAAIPNVVIESAELSKDLLAAVVMCKNGRQYRFRTSTTADAYAIIDKMSQIACTQRYINDFYTSQVPQGPSTPPWLKGDPEIGLPLPQLETEFQRLHFSTYWKLSNCNLNYGISKTYPPYLIVPKGVTDHFLAKTAEGRFKGRIPVAVWRDSNSAAVLLRSSQPVISLIGNPLEEDVRLVDLCRLATGEDSKFVIIDCRAYTSALANRAKGGGFESPTVYQHCKVKFMNLPNIHYVRNAFVEFRKALASGNSLRGTEWLKAVGCIIASAKRCSEYLGKGISVLVHCSDGWDRTTQIVSLAKLLGDPYYRTMEGFEVLVRSDWIGFGHKFNDRNFTFNSPSTEAERSPIFLQWLDCVFQLCVPTAFGFNQNYLVKIAQHCYSGLFGTFIFNSLKEHKDVMAGAGKEVLPSLWTFFRYCSSRFKNRNFNPEDVSLTIPSNSEIVLWKEVYMTDDERKKNLTMANSDSSLNFLNIFDVDGLTRLVNIGLRPRGEVDKLITKSTRL
ncbi:hypothetical protein L596_025574 [Steinernema carpocapsae]|uniref:Myotubularin phosphatase domain-containing protein n=1 Tax=Steinernema carpocapsae TaxID=34508 RepID=A0A4U5M858_STECR|nr:hypothetical protein L596_025574 [Steinernema carpocapsae]